MQSGQQENNLILPWMGTPAPCIATAQRPGAASGWGAGTTRCASWRKPGVSLQVERAERGRWTAQSWVVVGRGAMSIR